MSEGRFVDAAIRRRIGDALDAIEREHAVRILVAVESGSRAWRFPSVDSDYDVRFVYVHPAGAYLAVEPPRDVIERPVDALLDVGGWDLRKALRLALRTNAPLLEWLASPVRYRSDAAAEAALASLARAACRLPALAYHYDRQARRSWEEIRSAGAAVRLKAYCYALRSALALLWLRERAAPPPMDLPALLQGTRLPPAAGAAIAALVTRKAAATERELGPRDAALDGLLETILAEPAPRVAPAAPDPALAARADALLAALAGWPGR
ncbi:MAG: nucleotidyltransferase domain-containing protein [Dongiaceae bacterium]